MNTDTSVRIVSGLLFLTGSPFALWWLRREYRQRGRLTAFGSFIHVVMYALHGMFLGTLVWGVGGAPVAGGVYWLGIPLMVIGLGITLYAMHPFHAFLRWMGTSTPGLYTNSLYRFSRNPQFVGYGLLLLGFSIAWWNDLVWLGLLGYAALVYAVTLVEEEHLAHIYGDPYREYCQRVPRYLGLPKRN